MRKGGIPPKDANFNGILTFICDGFWFADKAFETGGASRLTQSSYIAGQNSLGGNYLPATITSTRVGPDRRDGVGSVRHFAFFDGCSCFRYTSGKIRLRGRRSSSLCALVRTCRLGSGPEQSSDPIPPKNPTCAAAGISSDLLRGTETQCPQDGNGQRPRADCR